MPSCCLLGERCRRKEEGGTLRQEHWDSHSERGKRSPRAQTGQAGRPDHLRTTEKQQQATSLGTEVGGQCWLVPGAREGGCLRSARLSRWRSPRGLHHEAASGSDMGQRSVHGLTTDTE